MAIPPRIKRISREDLPGSPGWVEPLLRILNEAIGGLVDALSRRLTRTENLLGGRRVVEVATAPVLADTFDPPIAVKHDMPTRPNACWIGRVEAADNLSTPSAAVSLSWRMDDEGNISITAIPGLDTGRKYRITILYE